MEPGYVLLALVAIAHFWFQERNKRKASYTLHIQGRTEEAETLDFAVVLYADETKEQWKKKMDECFEIQEHRRGYNNERVLKMMEEDRKRVFEAAKAAEPKQNLKLKEG